MSYQALARKWRPQQFVDVIGQEHAVRALTHALDRDQLHHAYLFTGTRGVGKTTIARIFAKCLNCEQGISSKPCGECSSCCEIAEGRFMDLIEVDAASQRKVEQTQDLLENAQYAPSRGRFKVYIIDEVHMLSDHSFNALLKTLEEPPPHVKFLLATTDPQKLPATVLSRCLQFTLKNMPSDRIADHLAVILGKESIVADKSALQLLGRAAAGSMRDALSLADQAISFGDGTVVEASVREMLGTVDRGLVFDLADAIAADDAKAALERVAQLAELGAEMDMVLQDLAAAFQRAALCQLVPDLEDGQDSIARSRHLGALLDKQDLQLFYQIAVQGRADMPLAPDPRAGLEMLVCRMLAFRLGGQASGGAGNTPADGLKKKPEPAVSPAPATASAAAPEAAARAIVTPPITDTGLPNWRQLLESIELTGLARRVAAHCELRAIHGQRYEFVLDDQNAQLFQPAHQEQIAQVLSAHLGQSITVVIALGTPQTETPAQARQREQQALCEEARQSLEDDPQLHALKERFGATLDLASIQPLDQRTLH
ncbi:MAG TPA: DNA polymerase III subunit gamma/tau [Pseudomonadales bacterium]